jgi:regulatory protein
VTADAVEVALQKAYRYLGRRDRTEAELRKHLLGKGFTDAVTEAALEELAELGYVDDARFAVRFAEDRRRLDAWGSERIERRLRELGVASDHVAVALVSHDDGAELGAAVGLLRRRFPVPPASDRERERALGLLVRRGYDLELAYDAVRALGRPEAA